MYLERETMTATLSTLGAATFYSTGVFNGVLHGAYLKVPKAVGNSATIKLTAEGSSWKLLTIANPSTLGAWYYPKSLSVGTSGQVLASSAHSVSPPIVKERVKCVVASSSGLVGGTVTVMVVIGG